MSKSTLTDRWIAKLKNNPFIAVACIFTAVTAVVLSLNKELRISDRFTSVAKVSVLLSDNSNGFELSQDPKFAAGPIVDTFGPKYPFSSKPSLVITLLIQNDSDRDMSITHVIYDVNEIGEVRGGAPGTMNPMTKLHHEIKHQTGIQSFQIPRPLRIVPKSSETLDIHITSADPGYGLAWYLRVGCSTNLGKAYSGYFQLYLPKKAEPSH
jgi:hypothetical protein